MPKSRKYSPQVTRNDGTWTAEIVRRVSAKKSVVSKSQDGFASEQEALDWTEQEMKIFLALNERNKKKS